MRSNRLSTAKKKKKKFPNFLTEMQPGAAQIGPASGQNKTMLIRLWGDSTGVTSLSCSIYTITSLISLDCFVGYLKEPWLLVQLLVHSFCFTLSVSASGQGEQMGARSPNSWMLEEFWGMVMKILQSLKSHWPPLLTSTLAEFHQSPGPTSPCHDGLHDQRCPGL